LKGDLIGEIKDIWGEVKQEIFAPADGMILMYINNPVVGPGDVVLGYAEF
jgi:predicted deacylase